MKPKKTVPRGAFWFVLVLALLQLPITFIYFNLLPPFVPSLRDTGSRDYIVSSQKDQDLLVSILNDYGVGVVGMDDTDQHRNVFCNDGTGVIWLKQPQPDLGDAAGMTLVSENPAQAADAIVKRLQAAGHKDAEVIQSPVKEFAGLLVFIKCPSLSPHWTLGVRKHFLDLPSPKPYNPSP